MGGKQSRHQSHNDNYSYSNPQNYCPSVSLSSRYSVYSSRNYDDYERKQQVHSRYSRIGDNYHSPDQVTLALAEAGLESSNLIVGIDFTKSNEWTGARSFHHKSLHHLGTSPNPYEQAISIIGKTLSAFDEDNLLPCYGFGDATTHDQEVFSFYPDDRPCNGFEEVLRRYREIVPHIILAGPTSFAPIIEAAIRIVDNSGGLYHVLMIIADGQVTRSVDTGYSHLSPQEQNTINAIVKASEYPLSIVLVGVGDGPWDMMRKYDDNIPARAFDNFQFVNFTEIMSKHNPMSKKETDFALSALMEIPLQYKATIDLQLLGRRRGNPGRLPLPPPVLENSSPNSNPNNQWSSSNEQRMGYPYAPPTPCQHYAPPTPAHHYAPPTPTQHFAPPTPTQHSLHNRECSLCLWRTKDLVFGCGHQTCYDCGHDLSFCPTCQIRITTRIRLYE